MRDSMAERAPSPVVDEQKHKNMAKKYTRRGLGGALRDTLVDAAANRTVQSTAAVVTLAAGAKIAYDNLTLEENQADKLKAFPPNRLVIGTVKFKAGERPDLKATPIDDSEAANSLYVVGMGENKLEELEKEDEIVLTNPLALQRTTRSGIKTTWIQVPNALSQGLLAKNRLIGYAKLGVGTVNGTFYEITGETDTSYLLKDHEPLPKTKAQIYSVQKSA